MKFSKTGYKKNSKDKNNSYNYIKGGRITMKDVEQPLMAIPYNLKGEPMPMQILYPGEEYDFGTDVSYVMEMPYNKQINFQMGGQFPTVSLPYNNSASNNIQPPYISEEQEQQMYLKLVQEGNEQAARNFRFYNPLDFNSREKVQTVSELTPKGITTNYNYNTPKGSYQYQELPQVDINPISEQTLDNFLPTEQDKVRFFNPYGGYDIPTAAFTLGQGIEEKNPLKIAGSSLKVLSGLGRNLMSGIGQQRRGEFVLDETNEKLRNSLTNTQYLKEGGDIEKLMTSDYVTGTENNEQVNTELEEGEYLKLASGEVSEVIGNKHSDGGEKFNLPQGKVISDYRKVGKEGAKKFKNEYGINVKPTDTYATVMDKYISKIGLKKLIDEQENILKEINNQSDTDNKTTYKLNMQLLSERMSELEEEKKPLEKMKQEFFEKVFVEQEEMKENNSSSYDLESLSQQYGLPKEKVQELISKFQNGGEFTQEDSLNRLKDFYNQMVGLGFNEQIDFNADDLGQQAGKMQKWLAANRPEQVVEYFENGIPITSKGVDIIKEISPELFDKIGVPITIPSADLTPEQRVALQEEFKNTGKATRDFWLNQFQDNRWDFRYVNIPLDLQASGIKETNQQPTTSSDVSSLNRQQNEPVEEKQTPTISQNKELTEDTTRLKDSMSVLNLPDQTPIPPTSLQPQYMGRVRLGEVEPMQISPEQNIAEIERQKASIERALSLLPDSQRQAALAQLSANTQQNINTAITQSQLANQQAQLQADQFNVGQQGKEDILNLENALNYEQKVQRGLSNYQQSIDNYFNAMRQNQLGKYNEIDRLNLLNQLYDNFQYTGEGIEQTSSPFFTNPLLIQGGDIEKILENYLKNK